MNDVPLELQVWDAQACADYLKESVSTFMRTTRFAEGFPSPLKNFDNKRPRWAAKAVIDWALS